jgi:HAE1 family hydrophobic/amphiphilic exporter-1
LPLAVILSLPIGVFGSFLLLYVRGLANDVYSQIGMVMLVGQLGKNAILIVEFAVQKRQQGNSLTEAAVEGARIRFRPIQMTSLAFIAGLFPLMIATGPGAIGNQTIGTTGVGGMLLGTVVGIFFIPGLYYVFARIADGRKLLRDDTTVPLSELPEYDHPLPPEENNKGHPSPAAAATASGASADAAPPQTRPPQEDRSEPLWAIETPDPRDPPPAAPAPQP